MVAPGDRIKFHGGWSPTGERCPVCNFSCGFIEKGTLVGKFEHPSDVMWQALLDTGAYAVGHAEQFEKDEA